MKIAQIYITTPNLFNILEFHNCINVFKYIAFNEKTLIFGQTLTLTLFSIMNDLSSK